MITAQDCLDKYGDPEHENNMVLWDIPSDLEVGVIPKRLYCNKDLMIPLGQAFYNVIHAGLSHELKTFDGCFNIRRKRGSNTPSLHSWGVAVDLNAAWNRMGIPPTFSQKFVNCFIAAGFDWGGKWKTPDGMHFQLSKL